MARYIWLQEEMKSVAKTISPDVLASEVVASVLTIEEIARLYRFDDLDTLNDVLADQGLSRCVECGIWVDEVDD